MSIFSKKGISAKIFKMYNIHNNSSVFGKQVKSYISHCFSNVFNLTYFSFEETSIVDDNVFYPLFV